MLWVVGGATCECSKLAHLHFAKLAKLWGGASKAGTFAFCTFLLLPTLRKYFCFLFFCLHDKYINTHIIFAIIIGLKTRTRDMAAWARDTGWVYS